MIQIFVPSAWVKTIERNQFVGFERVNPYNYRRLSTSTAHVFLNAVVSSTHHSSKFTPFFEMEVVILISAVLSLGSEVVRDFPSDQHFTSHLSNELRRAIRRVSEKRLLFNPVDNPNWG